MQKIVAYFRILILLIGLSGVVFASDLLTIKDMRGIEVVIPKNPKRIATISDGFVEGVMTHLGVVDRVSAIGSWSLKRDYKYSFITSSGDSYALRGWNTMKFLNPWLDSLPCINSPQGYIISYETLANSAPDLVILRVGDCTVRGGNDEATQKSIKTIESLGIPLVVIYAPGKVANSVAGELSSMREEMRVIGDVFGMRDKALALFDYLDSTERLIRSRTIQIPDSKKPTLLYLGLNVAIAQKGGAGNVQGLKTPESFILESIVNAKNAYRGEGANIIMSTEQIYAANPDVILLPTFQGYHPPRELYESPDFSILRELDAVKNRRVYSMPWSPMNCSRRVEYPLDLLIVAKAAYPELFSDIKVHEFALEFYQKVYNVSLEQAKKLRSEQILDWTLEYDF